MNRRPAILILILVLLVLVGDFRAEPGNDNLGSSVDSVETVNVNDGRLVKYDFNVAEKASHIPNRAGEDYEGLSGGNNSLVPRNGGTAIRFDGLSRNIEVTNSSSLPARRTITSAFWIRPEEEQQANILGRYGTFHFYLDGDRIYFAVMANDTRIAEPSAEIEVGEWTYVVGMYDFRRGAQLYMNGDLVATENTTDETLDPLSRNVLINMGGWQDGFRGSVDEFSLWNRSLSETEVRMLSQDRERTLILSSQLRTAVTLLLVLITVAAALFRQQNRD